jgi:ABC-type sulfate/molybdate transport systems ATPase subunit
LRIAAEPERADSVALARMLAPEPDVVLMAEPLSGLDTRLRVRRNPQTSELKEAGTAVVMAAHDPDEAMPAGDLVALMGVRGQWCRREPYGTRSRAERP